MSTKTYLFLPFEIGLAHIGRSLAVAEELQSRGHRIIFAIPKRKHQLFANSSINFYDREEYYQSDQEIDLKYTTSYEQMKIAVTNELEMIKEFSPDAIIADHFIPALVVGTIANVKVFGIFNGQALPYNIFHPNLVPSHRTVGLLLNRVVSILWMYIVRKYAKPAFTIFKNYSISISFEQWRDSIVFINPEPSFYFPLFPKKANIKYIGPLYWTKYVMDSPDWLHTVQADGKTIYISFGGTGFHINKLVKVVEMLLIRNFRVVITTGTLGNSLKFSKNKNLFITQFIRSSEILSKVDITLCHGGYGTMMDSIKAGVPVVALPNNIDQIFHSMRMQELGLATSIFNFNLFNLIRTFNLDTRWINSHIEGVNPEAIVSAIEHVFMNIDMYRNNIIKFNNEYLSTNGSSEAADIIERGS